MCDHRAQSRSMEYGGRRVPYGGSRCGSSLAYIGQLLLVMLCFGTVRGPARLILALLGSQGYNTTFLDEMGEHRLTLGEAERCGEDFFERHDAILVQHGHTA